jgi:hypothetical protein
LSLRKSPTRTPAFLEAIRRNAQQSTGPRTRRGKAQSCLNRLKTGGRSRVYRQLCYETFERGRGQNKKMLEIDVGSRKVIENTRNKDVLSGDSADILGNSAPVLTENAHLGATKITFSMRFNRQCTALAMPRCESQNLTDTPVEGQFGIPRRTICRTSARRPLETWQSHYLPSGGEVRGLSAYPQSSPKFWPSDGVFGNNSS